MVVLLSSLFLSARVLQVLEHEKSYFLLFTGTSARIEPATLLFIISHPVNDAIVRK